MFREESRSAPVEEGETYDVTIQDGYFCICRQNGGLKLFFIINKVVYRYSRLVTSWRHNQPIPDWIRI